MNVRRTVSGILGVLTAVWTLYLVLAFMKATKGCLQCVPGTVINTWGTSNSAVDVLLLVAILLLVSSGVSLAGRWIGLPLSTLFSVLTIALVGLQWNNFGTINNLGAEYSAAAVILSLATIAADVWAILAKPVIAEENHPLNLPVFG